MHDKALKEYTLKYVTLTHTIVTYPNIRKDTTREPMFVVNCPIPSVLFGFLGNHYNSKPKMTLHAAEHIGHLGLRSDVLFWNTAETITFKFYPNRNYLRVSFPPFASRTYTEVTELTHVQEAALLEERETKRLQKVARDNLLKENLETAQVAAEGECNELIHDKGLLHSWAYDFETRFKGWYKIMFVQVQKVTDPSSASKRDLRNATKYPIIVWVLKYNRFYQENSQLVEDDLEFYELDNDAKRGIGLIPYSQLDFTYNADTNSFYMADTSSGTPIPLTEDDIATLMKPPCIKTLSFDCDVITPQSTRKRKLDNSMLELQNQRISVHMNTMKLVASYNDHTPFSWVYKNAILIIKKSGNFLYELPTCLSYYNIEVQRQLMSIVFGFDAV